MTTESESVQCAMTPGGAPVTPPAGGKIDGPTAATGGQEAASPASAGAARLLRRPAASFSPSDDAPLQLPVGASGRGAPPGAEGAIPAPAPEAEGAPPAPAPTPSERLVPREGETLLVVRPEHVDLILLGEKTLEIRPWRMKRIGRWFLATRGLVLGKVTLGAPFQIRDADAWVAHAPRHREGTKMRHRPGFCWAYPLSRPVRVEPLPFEWCPGAMTLCKYRLETSLPPSSAAAEDPIEAEVEEAAQEENEERSEHAWLSLPHAPRIPLHRSYTSGDRNDRREPPRPAAAVPRPNMARRKCANIRRPQ